MQKLFDQVLRISPEPTEYFEDIKVHTLLTDKPQAYLEFVYDELKAIAHAEIEIELPSKQIFRDPASESDFRVMPCVLRNEHFVRKTVKLVGTNTRQQCVPGKITVGKAFVIHPTENFISHEFDACLLSSARTGICATLAVKLLSRKRKSITIIGAGRVGYYAGLYISGLDQVETIHFYDTDFDRASSTASLLDQQCPDTSVNASKAKPDIDTDVLIVATNSSAPVYHPEDYYADTIVSLGADTEWQHELDQSLIKDSVLYTDTFDSLNYGDLHTWKEADLISTSKLTDILTLVKDGPSAIEQKRRVFISTGSALFDNLTIGYLLEHLSAGKE
jgi:ornithine cyclodeaminase/alanine dehydrogenase-like protein (mu-crystallin family)